MHSADGRERNYYHTAARLKLNLWIDIRWICKGNLH